MPTTPKQPIIIANVTNGGGLDNGNAVFFEAQLQGGGTERFALHHSVVGPFMAYLATFAGLAAKDRADHTKDNSLVEQAPVFPVDGIRISPLANLTGIGIVLQIQEGVSFALSLPMADIAPLAQSLLKWHSTLSQQANDQAGPSH